MYGLRLADGRRLWSWGGGQSDYDLWPWGDLVVVLTDQASAQARLTGLNAATGRVSWSLRLPGEGLDGNLAATSDGGLAMIRADGVLQVMSLADGRVRWTRRTGTASLALVAASGVVAFGRDGRMTGYDDTTGRPRWTVTGLPSEPEALLAGDLVLVTSGTSGGRSDPTAMTAIVSATGRVAWRFDRGAALTVLGAGPAGLVLTSYNPDRLYLLDPGTGRLRWRAETMAGAALVDAHSVVAVEGRQTLRIADRDAANGRIRWSSAISQIGSQPVLLDGQMAIVQGGPARSGQPAPLLAYRLADGRVTWQVGLPTYVPAAPVRVPGGMLLQPADPGYACPVAAVSSAAGSASAGAAATAGLS